MRSIAYLLISIAASLTLAACGGTNSDSEPAPAVDIGTLIGTHSGVFPCANCPGIDARLWLRADGAFFMRQDHRAAEGADVETTYALGRWAWDAGAGELVLRGHGPERRFHYVDGALQMAVSGLPHVLERDGSAQPFTDRMRFEGQYESSVGVGTLRDCVTGLQLAVRDDTAGRNLRRRHRAVSPANRAAWVSIEAHLAYGPSEVLAIDRLLAIRPGQAC
jgi:copper homeostasis protein (lipoprotein)